MAKWFVYIIECEDKSLYTGITNDLNRRFKEHSKGIGSKYTHSHKPVEILFSEKHGTRSEALKREWQIKGWSRIKKIKFIQNQNTSG
jgi:putative endonuclease